MANIILAEDDGSLRQFIAAALERAGHDVRAASDGMEALHLLQADPFRFDLLLTDIVMPGMDGIELARLANGLHPAIKVVFITGFAAMALEDNAALNGEAKLISKPFHLGALVAQVEKILGRSE